MIGDKWEDYGYLYGGEHRLDAVLPYAWALGTYKPCRLSCREIQAPLG